MKKYKYRIIEYKNGNDESIFKVKYKGRLFWFYLRAFEYIRQNIIWTVLEFNSYEKALEAIKKHAYERRKEIKEIVHITELEI